MSLASSLLTQARAWGFLTGVAASGAAYVAAKRDLWSSTAWLADRLPNPPPPPPPPTEPEPLVGPGARARAARAWNEAVDAVFGPLVRELSRRGW